MGAAHPTDPLLRDYGLRKLDTVSGESVSKHLDSCDSCRRRVAELSSDDFLDRLQDAQAMPDRGTSATAPFEASSHDGNTRPILPAPPVDTLPPELVIHLDYEIVRELGRGSMGVVYLANNRLMGRHEVLKVIGRHLVERPDVLERFCARSARRPSCSMPTSSRPIRPCGWARASSWRWSTSTGLTWPGWSRPRARYRSSTPVTLFNRPRWGCSMPTSAEWSIAISSRPT